jgi:TRAP-type mannitol/chloroaromatic compound transport system substrate-binding protein
LPSDIEAGRGPRAPAKFYLRGLKLRSLGLGGEVYRRLGATPPAEILASLQSGVLDGAEFAGPGTDIALGDIFCLRMI